MMIHSRKLRLWLYLVLLAVFIGACGMKKEESSKDKQIKENFNKTLSLYPTKNQVFLEDIVIFWIIFYHEWNNMPLI